MILSLRTVIVLRLVGLIGGQTGLDSFGRLIL